MEAHEELDLAIREAPDSERLPDFVEERCSHGNGDRSTLPVSYRYPMVDGRSCDGSGQRLRGDRRAVSIPSNIAEGQGRGTVRFGLHFIRIALGSSAELGTQAEVARRLRYVTAETTKDFDLQLDRVRQLLHGMRREHLRRIG